MGVTVREKTKGSGDWWVFINHCRVRKAKHFGSKKQAEKAKTIFEARLKLGQALDANDRPEKVAPSIPTLDAYFERFKKTLEGSVRESTQDCYEGRYDNQIKDDLGGLRLDHITRERVEEFASSLVGKGLSKDTIRLTLATRRKILNKALRGRLIADNPATRMGEFYRQAPTRHREIEPLTEGEVIRFLEAVRLHPSQNVCFFSALNDLSIFDASHPDPATLKLVPCREEAPIFSRVGALEDEPCNNSVPVSDNFFNIPMNVGERVIE